jgi:hypothetical protein
VQYGPPVCHLENDHYHLPIELESSCLQQIPYAANSGNLSRKIWPNRATPDKPKFCVYRLLD